MSSGSTATRKSSVASTLFKASSKFLHHNNSTNGSPKSVKRQKHSDPVSPDPEVCSTESINNLHCAVSSADESDKLLPSSSRSNHSGPGKLAAGGKKRFVGVRQRPSGRWVAEIKDTTQKIRLWLGTFDSAEDGARAYDEAAWLLRGANTRTNFVPTCGDSLGAVPASKAARLIRLRQIAAASKSGEFAASEVPEQKLVPEHHRSLKGSRSTQDHPVNRQQSITVVEPLNPSSEEDQLAVSPQSMTCGPEQKLVPEHHRNLKGSNSAGARSSTQDQHLMIHRQQSMITVGETLNHSVSEEEFIASNAQSASCGPSSPQPTAASSKPAELLQNCVRHNVESGEELLGREGGPADDARGLKLKVGSFQYQNSNDHSPVQKMESKQSLTSPELHHHYHHHHHVPMNSDPQADESSPLPSPKAHAHRNHCNHPQKESEEDYHQLQCFTGCKSEAATDAGTKVVKTEASSLDDTDQYNPIYSSPARLLESHRSINSELRSFAFSSIDSLESYPPHPPLELSRHQFTGEHLPPAAMVVPISPHEAQDSLIAPQFHFSCATNRDHVYPSDCKELSTSFEDFGSLGVGAHHENQEASSGQGHVMNSGESLNQSYNSEENDHCLREGKVHQVSTFSEEVNYIISPHIDMYRTELDRYNSYSRSAIRREREYADLLPEHSWPEFVYTDDTEMHESTGFFNVDLSCENSGVYASAFDFSAELAIDRDSCTSVLLEEQINHLPRDDNEVLLHRMDYEQSMSTNSPTSFPKCVLLTEPSEMDYSLSSPASLMPKPPLSPQETHSLSISSSLLWRVAGSSSGARTETLTGAEQSLSSDSAAGGGECSSQDQALWSSMDLPPLCMVA